MTTGFARLLVSGDIPQQGVDTLTGLLILAGLALGVLGLYYKIKKIRQDNKKEYNERLATETGRIEERIKLHNTLQELKDSNNRMSESICTLSESIRTNIERVEKRVDLHEKELVKVDLKASSAHNRIDEHRKFEHMLKNHSGNGNKQTDNGYEDYREGSED